MRSLSGLTTGSIMSSAMCDRISRRFKSWSSISTLATIIIIRWCGHDNITLKLHDLIFLVDLEHFFRQSEAWKIQRILSFYRCFGRRGTWRTSIFVASSQRSFDSSTARGSSWSRFTKFDFDGLEVDWEDMFSFVCCLLFVCCFGMLKVFFLVWGGCDERYVFFNKALILVVCWLCWISFELEVPVKRLNWSTLLNKIKIKIEKTKYPKIQKYKMSWPTKQTKFCCVFIFRKANKAARDIHLEFCDPLADHSFSIPYRSILTGLKGNKFEQTCYSLFSCLQRWFVEKWTLWKRCCAFNLLMSR